MLKNSAVNLAASFGELLIPMIDSLNNIFQKLIGWLGSLSDEQKQALVTLLEVVAIIGPLLLILGKLVNFVTKVMTILPKLKAAFVALNAVLAANPILLIVAAIAALVAAFVYLWNNCEEFRQFWIDLWEGIKEVFQAVVDWFAEAIDNVVNFFKELPDKIGAAIDAVVNWFATLPERIAYWLGYAVGKVVAWATEVWNTLSTAIPQLISDIGTWFSELPGRIWDWLVESYNRIVQWGVDTYNKAKETISNFLKAIVDGLKSLPGKFKEWFNKAIDFLKGLPKQMLQIGKDIFNGLWEGLKSIWNKITGWIDGVVQKIKSIFGAAKEGYNDATSSVKGSYASGLDYVPRDMNVRVHQGEAILTKEQNENRAGSSMFGVVNINIDGAKYSDEQELAKAMAFELQTLADRRASAWT